MATRCLLLLPPLMWGCAQILGIDHDFQRDTGGAGGSGETATSGAAGNTGTGNTGTNTGAPPCTKDAECTGDATPACCGGTCIARVAQVALGAYHTCAVETDGTLWCWGDNTHGQLGDGTKGGPDSACGGHCKLLPVQVAALGNEAVQVTAGDFHTCAVDRNAALWCWGDNTHGQLGDNTTTSHAAPTHVRGGVASVTAGSNHTCALRTSGTVDCWGDNNLGELGDGTTVSRAAPLQVSALGSNVIEVQAGLVHTCAITSDAGGTLWCWGFNHYGQLGNGAVTGHACASGDVCEPSPVKVVSLHTGVAHAAPGGFQTCARHTDGTVSCWGDNSNGEVGDGTDAGQDCNGARCKPSPIQVAALGTHVTHLSAGRDDSSCARKDDGTLWCWGQNGRGQLGDGTTARRLSPVRLTSMGHDVADVVVGTDHACARKADGTLRCWGENDHGELGDGTATGDDCGSGVLCKNKPVRARIGECH